MQKITALLAVAVVVLASTLNLSAGTLNGVTLPDTVQVGGTTLALNGLGLRTKYMVKVYVAGLYLQQKSSDADAIVKADAPKRFVMHFVRGVSKSQLTDGFSESFEDNSPDAAKSMKADIDRLFAVLGPVKDGDELIFTYLPGTGTSVSLAGLEQLSVAGPDLPK